MRLRDLEAALDGVPDFPAPDARLEQYRTPSRVAAGLLWEAHQDRAVADRDVLDLGCGTGTLAKGAVLLGARVVGVDQDGSALAVAREAVPEARFEAATLPDWSPPDVDTVVMNPPFGAQSRGADRPFHQAAAAAVKQRSGTVWFLQQPTVERFLSAMYRDLGMDIERVATWDYPLDARFGFHEDALRGITVAGYAASF